MNKVLVLGSGHMARPIVSYLSRYRNCDITVASIQLDQAEEIASLYERTTPVELSVHNEPGLSKLVSNSNLTISLVPPYYHLPVVKSCIRHKVNMLTSSYVIPDMIELQNEIVDAGITMVNEVGFDPGIDHMLAKQCIDEVMSYTSWCTGLPVPEVANVPLKYKFSWCPPSFILKTLDPATWLQDGKVKSLPEGQLMYNPQQIDLSSITPEVEFEGVFNHHSLKYIELYDIPEAHSIIRGSIRYKQELLADLMQTSVSTVKDDVLKRIDYDNSSLKEIEDMGLLSTDEVPLMGSLSQSLTQHLIKLLSYKPGEQDMTIIYSVIDVEWPDKSKEKKTITFIEYGDPNGVTAMDKCVGYPTGIAAKMMLEGQIPHKGIVLPITKDLYEPILEELKKYLNSATIDSTTL